MLKRDTRTKLFNNHTHLIAVRKLRTTYLDKFVWDLLGERPSFREIWVSETWLMRRTMKDVLLRGDNRKYKSGCRTCPIYIYYKNLIDPLRKIKRRLWQMKYDSIDSQRRRKAG